MSKSNINSFMGHLNGQTLVAMDIETTGLEVGFHEICQIGCIALDKRFKPMRHITPLSMYIKPDCPERAAKEALRKNRLKLETLMTQGVDTEQAKGVLQDWIDKLPVSLTNQGVQKPVIPVGQNFGFDRSFLQHWLGIEWYYEMFDARHRDTLQVAQYLNDFASNRGDDIPFKRTNLNALCTVLGVEYDAYTAHDALVGCKLTAEVYRCMMDRGWLV